MLSREFEPFIFCHALFTTEGFIVLFPNPLVMDFLWWFTLPCWIEVSSKAACFSNGFITDHKNDSTLWANVLDSLLNKAEAVHIEKIERSTWNYPVLGDANWLPSLNWKCHYCVFAILTWHLNRPSFVGFLCSSEMTENR